MKGERYKIEAKQDFGTWLKKGEIVEVSKNWVLFACDKGYAKLLKGETKRLKDVVLLKRYGLDPYKPSYGRTRIVKLLDKIEKEKKNVPR